MGSNPGLIDGKVPTAAEWNSYFSAKQDDLGFAPLSTGGGVLSGLLTIATSSTASTGLTLPPGSAPTIPNNGDIWTTASGLFVRIAGSTVNLSGGIVTSFAGGTLTGKLFTAASTSAISGLNVTPGANPASLVNGDVWITGSGLFCQLNGVPVPISSPAQLLGLPLKATPAQGDYLLLYDNTAGQLSKVTVGTVGPPDTDNPLTAPTYTSILSGSGNYNPPANCVRLRVRMKGDGGGGGAQQTNNGSNGNGTSFGGWTANPGGGGRTNNNGSGGLGGATGTNGTGTLIFRRSGAQGQGSSFNNNTVALMGAMGGGGVAGGGPGQSGGNAPANSGFGGGGAPGTSATGANTFDGIGNASGGGEGEEVEFIIINPAGPYAYSVGTGGSGGAAGNFAGGNGGSGRILIEEFYY